MNNFPIVFLRNLSIGLLDMNTMEFTRIEDVSEYHPLYMNIQPPFDWYYQDEIMIIPDPIPSTRPNWTKTLFIGTQEIECQGNFVAFFHFDVHENNMNFAGALTLPEYEFLKGEIRLI